MNAARLVKLYWSLECFDSDPCELRKRSRPPLATVLTAALELRR